VRDVRFPARCEPRRGRHVADRLRSDEADRRRRGTDRRAREESRELRSELATGPRRAAPRRRWHSVKRVVVLGGGFAGVSDAQTVQLRRRLSGQVVAVRYDALIIALGGVTDLAAVPGMGEHGVGVRTLGDAFYLRNRALDMLEEARIESNAERRERLLTFVVVGGGSTGVEVAAELRDLVELAARSFKDVRLEPRVVL